MGETIAAGGITTNFEKVTAERLLRIKFKFKLTAETPLLYFKITGGLGTGCINPLAGIVLGITGIGNAGLGIKKDTPQVGDAAGGAVQNYIGRKFLINVNRRGKVVDRDADCRQDRYGRKKKKQQDADKIT